MRAREIAAKIKRTEDQHLAIFQQNIDVVDDMTILPVGNELDL